MKVLVIGGTRGLGAAVVAAAFAAGQPLTVLLTGCRASRTTPVR